MAKADHGKKGIQQAIGTGSVNEFPYNCNKSHWENNWQEKYGPEDRHAFKRPVKKHCQNKSGCSL